MLCSEVNQTPWLKCISRSALAPRHAQQAGVFLQVAQHDIGEGAGGEGRQPGAFRLRPFGKALTFQNQVGEQVEQRETD